MLEEQELRRQVMLQQLKRQETEAEKQQSLLA
jgi:hypothetical protein